MRASDSTNQPLIRRCLFVLVLLLFCLDTAGANPHSRECFFVLDNVDEDFDGLSDSLENCIARRHAPLIYLPLSFDYVRPASVGWYLKRTQVRHHSDQPVENTQPIAANIFVAQNFRNDDSSRGQAASLHHVSLNKRLPRQETENPFYFEISPDTDRQATRSGSEHPEQDWKVYVHSYPKTSGRIGISYWYFFPFNNHLNQHEGDWEHITVNLNAKLEVIDVSFYRHGGPSTETITDVSWYKETHPTVWIANGSHASYVSELRCDLNWLEMMTPSCETTDGHRWFTWQEGRGNDEGFQGFGLVQLGETTKFASNGRPMNGQEWILFSGRWGTLGLFPFTSGPKTPSAQDDWGLDQITDVSRFSVDLELFARRYLAADKQVSTEEEFN